jgi:hypothetical protein
MPRTHSPEQVDQIAASSKLVLSLIRRTNETKSRVQSEAVSLGEEIKAAVEDKHLHAGALRHVARLARMDPGKCADLMRAIDLYMDYAIEAGLFGYGHTGDLVDQAREAAAGEDASAGNVHRLRGAIKQLDESQATS